MPAQRVNRLLRDLRGPFLLSGAANIAWLFLWYYEYIPLSLLAMLVLLASLLVIYRRVSGSTGDLSPARRWSVQHPFSIYLGWITVATIINASVVLYYLRWRGAPLSEESWTLLLLAIIAVLASWVTICRNDTAYAAVIVWALVGIVVKQGSTPVAVAAGIAAAVVGAVAVYRIVNRVRV